MAFRLFQNIRVQKERQAPARSFREAWVPATFGREGMECWNTRETARCMWRHAQHEQVLDLQRKGGERERKGAGVKGGKGGTGKKENGKRWEG